jgi:hypothetical protein
MRNPSVLRLCILLLLVTLGMPDFARAQPNNRDDHDRLWNGMLIGAGVGAAVGMLVAPPAFCGGGHDSECAAIVRATIGLASIAGGIGVGALVDGLQHRDATTPFRNGRPVGPRLSGVQVSLTF